MRELQLRAAADERLKQPRGQSKCGRREWGCNDRDGAGNLLKDSGRHGSRLFDDRRTSMDLQIFRIPSTMHQQV